jgi:hypothetical protein
MPDDLWSGTLRERMVERRKRRAKIYGHGARTHAI